MPARKNNREQQTQSTGASRPRRERPGTYFVSDRFNQEEVLRVQVQDQLVTARMGGVLPEQSDPAAFQRILDVGCGSGDWLIETAKQYPRSMVLIGVDVSEKMVDYARERAMQEQVEDRVEFHVMDALRKLEFPQSFFDLINQRFGASWLRTWDWTNLLSEYLRVARPGAVIRVTEAENVGSNSPALTRFSEILLQAFHQSGHTFTPEKAGVTKELADLLRRHRLEQVQARHYALEYRAGEPEWERFVADMQHLFQTMLPFAQKWLRVPGDYDALCQQALVEMQEPDFVANGNLLTAWGIVPADKDQVNLRPEQR